MPRGAEGDLAAEAVGFASCFGWRSRQETFFFFESFKDAWAVVVGTV